MIAHKKISLIIPCRNEEKALKKLLPKIPTFIDEVIVVDNKSVDNTAKVARALGAKVYKEKRTMNGIGYGYALMTGFEKAKGDFIITMDGDDTYPIDTVPKMMKHMEKNGLDVISGSRLPLKDPTALPLFNRTGIYILNLEIAILYGFPMKDTLSGMWLIRRKVLQKLGLRMGDWNISPEIKLAALAHKDIGFEEYGIGHCSRIEGETKQQYWKTGMNHALYILKRRFTQDKWYPFDRLIQKIVDIGLTWLSRRNILATN